MFFETVCVGLHRNVPSTRINRIEQNLTTLIKQCWSWLTWTVRYRQWPPGHVFRSLLSLQFCSSWCLLLMLRKRLWVWLQSLRTKVHKVHYNIFYAYSGQYGIGNDPQGMFSGASCLCTFVALDVCYWCCKNGSGSDSNSWELGHASFQDSL